MKKITMVFVGCFMCLFLVLFNTGYVQSLERYDGDFHVVFPQRGFVDLSYDPSLVLSWHDPDLDLEADQIYKVVISEDQLFKEPIYTNRISNVNFKVLDNRIIKDIGLEPGITYYWRVKKFSHSEGRAISTDIGSFADIQQRRVGGDPEQPEQDWPGAVWGRVCDEAVVQVCSLRTGECINDVPSCRYNERGESMCYYGVDQLDSGYYKVHYHGMIRTVIIQGPNDTKCHFFPCPPD
jgi:hypothetical protein